MCRLGSIFKVLKPRIIRSDLNAQIIDLGETLIDQNVAFICSGRVTLMVM